MLGGFLALSFDTRTTFGMKESVLVTSPFSTFLVPDLFLFLVIGLCNLALLGDTLRKYRPFLITSV